MAQNEKKIYRSVEAIWDDVRLTLTRGVADARHPWHHPVIGTMGPSGVELRTVILRRYIPDRRLLAFHTDRRSPKIAHITADPRVAWLFYDPVGKVQLRISAHAEIHVDTPLAEEQWERTQLYSRRCYMAPHAPSDPVPEWDPNLPEAIRDRRPETEESEAGRVNFAVVATRVESIDWLYLRGRGHQRARLTWPAGRLKGQWLAP